MRLALTSILVCLAALLLAYKRDFLLDSDLSYQIKSYIFRSGPSNISTLMSDTTIPKPFEDITAVSQLGSSFTTSNMTTPRLIRTVFRAFEQSEGAGARVRRSVGSRKMPHLSPFLMLDEAILDPPAGIPDHPHRGQETITYMLAGAVDHEDFAGNKGTIWTGDLQFMTAGRGIMHAEMPRYEAPDPETGAVPTVVGMQLWVDLPQKLKKCEPRYRDLRASEIPQVKLDDGKVDVKVISGQSHGVDSVKELAYTPVWMLDIAIRPGGNIEQALPKGWNAFAYVLEGAARFGIGKSSELVPKSHSVVFEQEGDTVVVAVDGKADIAARLLLFAGQPLDQKVVQRGPFVLNTEQEAYDAIIDFQTNSNGFERALNWESEIAKAAAH